MSGENENFEGITAEDLEIFKKLKEKIKKGKAQLEETTKKIFEPALNALDPDAVFSTIAMSGGNKISITVKLPDDRKLQVILVDKTITKKD